MPIVTVQELLDAGVHFGHRTRRWNPKMKPFIHAKRNTIHIIDLRETVRGLLRSTHFLRAITAEGYDVLFVGTKRGAKGVLREEARRTDMPYVTERWLGGTLTNFDTIRRRLARLEELEAMETSGDIRRLSKKDLAKHNREKRKLLKNLDGIRKMTHLPGAVIVVDPRREAIAVREANRMNIPIVALVDTDCDPEPIDLPIPANDDAMRSISVIVKRLTDACEAGKKAAKTRSGELKRGGVDDRTKSAIAEATGEAGRRGPAKKVVVRRAAPGPAAKRAPAPAPAAPKEAAPAPVTEPPAEAPAEPVAVEEAVAPAVAETPAAPVVEEAPAVEPAPAADAPAAEAAAPEAPAVEADAVEADEKPADEA